MQEPQVHIRPRISAFPAQGPPHKMHNICRFCFFTESQNFPKEETPKRNSFVAVDLNKGDQIRDFGNL